MNDLISRQQALKEMWKALYEYEDKTEKQFQESKDLDVRDWIMNDRLWVQNGHNLCVNVLANLPSAQPRWIPCSERLPEHHENDDYYLVTIQCEHYDGWDDYVTGFAEWTKHGWDELSCYIGQIKVIAWMPLPKPYGGESE